MNGEIAANRRMAGEAIRNDSARQGAAIAFRHTRSSSTVAAQSSAATAAALAGRSNRNNTRQQQEAAPEVGSVKDKIGRFAANSLAPPTSAPSQTRGSTPSISPSPEHIAARLAAARSPARKPEPAVDAARIGAMRSASRMQSQSRSPAPERELRSPTPVRPYRAREIAVERMLQDDTTLPASDLDVGATSSPSEHSARSRAGSVQSRASSVKEQTPSLQPPVVNRPPTITRASPEPPDDPKLKPSVPPRSIRPAQDSLRKPVHAGSQLRSPTPGLASVSGRSRGSSSSAVDEFNGIDEEALSNAIVASSLASARAPARAPTATPTPPPPPAADGRDLSCNWHHLSEIYPERQARQRKNILHKHPHKHHEGDRKRWKQEVTEKERKRYEGVWASNKGLHIPPDTNLLDGAGRGPPPSDMVLNLVVREIWSRSRLPPTALEQVWDLVDHRHVGLLSKEEFVVGMWLIDQQLKGHKLPAIVPESIWNSVKYVTGIKLSSIRPKG
ncbi:hypothetical protein N7468_001189 [Penicillium chermesinum]|uniref:EH domain-containing protein n=1 Tax=Penicillium chermesinum TaxID=63820 RepID=A0A9W9PHV5_9EURO|nr:uncharacterized protein N7468_001189 [Penicillium chermesinum]KAJ5246206.1 hypothetical protein N7468_001189 [Penicillium chermesinum]